VRQQDSGESVHVLHDQNTYGVKIRFGPELLASQHNVIVDAGVEIIDLIRQQCRGDLSKYHFSFPREVWLEVEFRFFAFAAAGSGARAARSNAQSDRGLFG